MISIIFALGMLQTQLLEMQAEIPHIDKPTIVYSLKRYKYRSVTSKTQYLPINEWKAQLRKCESGGNDKAINPMDLDGTPSYGRYQFKPKTFYGFAKKYGITVSDYRNGEEQEFILDKMITDNTVDLTFQFPACTSAIGVPLLNYEEFSPKKE